MKGKLIARASRARPSIDIDRDRESRFQATSLAARGV